MYQNLKDLTLMHALILLLNILQYWGILVKISQLGPRKKIVKEEGRK
jgi:hypothetical protein